jgi:hypothetical protein
MEQNDVHQLSLEAFRKQNSTSTRLPFADKALAGLTIKTLSQRFLQHGVELSPHGRPVPRVQAGAVAIASATPSSASTPPC